MTRGRLSPALATTSRIYELWDSARRGRGEARPHGHRGTTPHHATRHERDKKWRRARARSHHERSVARAKDRGGRKRRRKEKNEVRRERESEKEERRQQAGRQQSVVAT